MVSCHRSHSGFIFLTQHPVLKPHPWCCVFTELVLSSFRWYSITDAGIHSSVPPRWTPRLLPLPATVHSVCHDALPLACLLWTCMRIFLGYTPQSRIAGSQRKHTLHLTDRSPEWLAALGYCVYNQTLFHSRGAEFSQTVRDVTSPFDSGQQFGMDLLNLVGKKMQ